MNADASFTVALVATAILTAAILACTGIRCSDADDRKLAPCIPQGVTGTLNPEP